MENKFSKLYNKVYQETLNKLEIEIKNFMIKQKLKHKYLNQTHNLILERLTISNSEEFYVISEKALIKVHDIYKKKYDEYEEGYAHIIFNDMFEEFNLTTGIKPNFSFNNLICELAKIDATNEAYRLFRNSSRISDLMYENNNFDKFSLRKISGNIELDEVFKEQRWIKIDRENNGKYKSREEFENLEIEAQRNYNKHIFGDISFNRSPNLKKVKKELNNFKIIEDFKKGFSKLYLELVNKIILDKSYNSFDDFKNVFFEDWDNHESEVVFASNFTKQEIAYFLRKIEKYFTKLNQASIERSGHFYFFDENDKLKKITRLDLANNFKPMNSERRKISFTNQIKIDEIDSFISKFLP